MTDNRSQEKVDMTCGRQLIGTTATVTGASRGFARAISASLVQASAYVVGVARRPGPLNELLTLRPEMADITASNPPRRLLFQSRPQSLVLNAGVTPPIGPISQ